MIVSITCWYTQIIHAQFYTLFWTKVFQVFIATLIMVITLTVKMTQKIPFTGFSRVIQNRHNKNMWLYHYQGPLLMVYWSDSICLNVKDSHEWFFSTAELQLTMHDWNIFLVFTNLFLFVTQIIDSVCVSMKSIQVFFLQFVLTSWSEICMFQKSLYIPRMLREWSKEQEHLIAQVSQICLFD